MAKSKQAKTEMLNYYTDRLKSDDGVILVDYTMLTANQVNEFKHKLQAMGGNFNVIKNTIFKLALEKAELPVLPSIADGMHAAVFVGKDVAAISKQLKDFMTANEDKVVINSGILEGQALTAEQVKELADMPTKEQSVAMIAGILTQPVAGVANVLQDGVRSVALILELAFKE